MNFGQNFLKIFVLVKMFQFLNFGRKISILIKIFENLDFGKILSKNPDSGIFFPKTSNLVTIFEN